MAVSWQFHGSFMAVSRQKKGVEINLLQFTKQILQTKLKNKQISQIQKLKNKQILIS